MSAGHAGRLLFLTTLAFAFTDCTCRSTSPLQARKGFSSKLTPRRDDSPLDVPPASHFSIVQYDGPTGKLQAYLSPPPAGPGLVPGVVYLSGGFPVSSPGAGAWQRASPRNDQSGRQFREAGLALMLPVLRGVSGNPGQQEGFLGEVDDVLAAIDFLSKQPGVDPKRLYLVGHSTGGTLALLVGESTTRLRGVFSYGPVTSPCDYGPSAELPFDVDDSEECDLRSPLKFVGALTAPTLIMEGDEGNTDALALFAKERNPHVRVVRITGSNHFLHLGPLNGLIASTIRDAAVDVDPRPTREKLLEAAAIGRDAPMVVESKSWRFMLPPDAEPTRSEQFAEAFLIPIGAQRVMLLETEPLEVDIDAKCPLPIWAHDDGKMSKLKWGSREVCLGRWVHHVEPEDFVEFEVALPVKPALMLHAECAKRDEDATRRVLEKAVSSVEGESNWP